MENLLTLDITLRITSENMFECEVYEPESGDLVKFEFHDRGETVREENEKLAEEIRSWVTILRERSEEEKITC